MAITFHTMNFQRVRANMTEKNVAKKRGQLSLGEMQFIREHAESMSPDVIATELNRTVEPIKRYLAEEKLINANEMTDESEIIALRKRLRSTPYWPEVIKQLSDEGGEIDYFEKVWIGMMRQFKEDVNETELIYIKQFIITEILTNRSQKDIARYVKERDKAENERAEEYEKDVAVRDTAKISFLDSSIIQLGNAIGSLNNSYIKLSDQLKQIGRDLKATRDQRFEKIEKAGQSWIGLLRALDDAEEREKRGKEMELMRLAAEKAKNDLSEYHTYLDNKVDVPFLNFETVPEE